MPSLSACSSWQEKNRETIYQVALLQSLTQGYYDGIILVSELKQHGDTGIGTFEGVNGEMIVLDGKVYQASATAASRKRRMMKPCRFPMSHSLITIFP